MNIPDTAGFRQKGFGSVPLPLLQRDFKAADRRLRHRPINPLDNDLLAALPGSELAFLMPHLEPVELPYDKRLWGQGSSVAHVYFPTTAVIAQLYLLADGAMTEIGVTGREGMLGVSVLMSENTLGTATVQSAGHAYRLKAAILKNACAHCTVLHDLLMRYTHALFAQLAQNSVCGHHYSIDQQLSRWLLDRVDRLPSNRVKATHELIANMLGVRRESITEAAGRLKQQGLIHYHRGEITVLDHDGLERYAGECYRVVRHAFDLVRERGLAGSGREAAAA